MIFSNIQFSGRPTGRKQNVCSFLCTFSLLIFRPKLLVAFTQRHYVSRSHHLDSFEISTKWLRLNYHSITKYMFCLLHPCLYYVRCFDFFTSKVEHIQTYSPMLEIFILGYISVNHKLLLILGYFNVYQQLQTLSSYTDRQLNKPTTFLTLLTYSCCIIVHVLLTAIETRKTCS